MAIYLPVSTDTTLYDEQTSGGATTLTFTVPTGVSDGDHLMIRASGDDNAETWSTPATVLGCGAWTQGFQLNAATNDDMSTGMWWCVVNSSADAIGQSAILIRSGSEELAGILEVVSGAHADFLDVTYVEATHSVQTNNVDGTPNITPKPITTLTDGAVVIIQDVGRSWGEVASDTIVAPTGYSYEGASGAPGRVYSGTGNGDVSLVAFHKTVASNGTETPGQITGITGNNDHATVTYAIKPAAAAGDDYSHPASIVETHAITSLGGVKDTDGASSIATTSHAVTPVGDKQGSGVSSITHTHDVTTTGEALELHSGSASIVHDHSVTSAGAKQGSGVAAVVVSAPGVIATGDKQGKADVSIDAPHSIVGAGQKDTTGDSDITHGHSVTATGTRAEGEDYAHPATIVQGHTAVTVGTKQGSDTSTLTNSSSVIVTGDKGGSGDGVLTAVSGISATGTHNATGSATIPQVSSVVVTGDKAGAGTATIGQGHAVTATGVKAEGEEYSHPAAITQGHSITAAGQKDVDGDASITQSESVVSTGATQRSGDSSIVETHTTVATGGSASWDLSGSATITVASSVVIAGSKQARSRGSWPSFADAFAGPDILGFVLVSTADSTGAPWLTLDASGGRGLTDDHEARGRTGSTSTPGVTVGATQPGLTDDLHSPGETS